MMRLRLWITVVLALAIYVAAFAQRRIGDGVVTKVQRVFEKNTVTLPAMPNTSVTFVPEASGAITVFFDPPVQSVTGEWFTASGTFTGCSPQNNCVEVDEAGGPDSWHGGVGISAGIERVRFSGGADFNVFSVIE